MARAYGYSRCFGIAAALSLCITASLATFVDRGTPATDGWSGNSIVVSFVSDAYTAPFAFEVPAAIQDYRAAVSLRHPPDFSAMVPHERPSFAAVRPSAVAGWRSGRVRRLATV